ncbi:MAG: NTP transferase domain-containing protein, partial [Bdellovibrio sp.]
FLSAWQNQWTGTELEKLPQLVDQVEGLGPIGGILTALESQPEANWFVVACDLPFVTQETIQKLLADFDSKAVATCYPNAEKGFPEALCAIYSPAALNVFRKAIADGIHCPVKVLKNTTVKVVQADRYVNLSNINTPEELANARGTL